MTSVTIPSSVAMISSGAFQRCKKLTDVYCLGGSVYAAFVSDDWYEYDDSSFDNYNVTLHVPASSLVAYQTTEPWCYFKTIVPIINPNEVYTLTYLVDNNIYKQYDMAHGATITPEPEPVKEGYTFSGWSEIPESMPAHDVTVSGYFTLSDVGEPETETIRMTMPDGDCTAIGYSSAYGLDFTNVTKVKAWVVTGFTDQAEVLLSRVKIVPPYTGLYLTSDVAGVEVTVPTTEQDIWYANLLLPAVEEETIAPTEMKDGEEYTNFVVGKLYSGEMGFVRVTATSTLGPNKSRLLVPSRYYSSPGYSRGGLRVDFIDEQMTDIGGTMSQMDRKDIINDNDVYDLQGRRVAKSQLTRIASV